VSSVRNCKSYGLQDQSDSNDLQQAGEIKLLSFGKRVNIGDDCSGQITWALTQDRHHKVMMKIQKNILIVLTFFACIAPVIAQEKKPSLPAGAQTVIIDGASGTEYLSAAGRFKIRFSGVPKEFEETNETSVGTLVSHTVLFVKDVAESVSYRDYPGNLELPSLIKRVLDDARDRSLALVAKEEPHILSETDVSVEGHPGRLVRVEVKDQVLRVKVLVVANRTYVLMLRSPKLSRAQSEDEKLATSFFNSFKLLTPLEADLTGTWKEFLSAEGKFKIKFPGTPYQTSLQLAKELKFQVAGYQSAGSYSVRYVDFPEIVKDPAALKVFLDSMRDAELEYLEQRGKKFEILSETDVAHDRYLGRMLVLELPNNVIYRNKTIVVNNRLYVLTALVPKDDAQSATGNVYEQLSMKFIDSFGLLVEGGKRQ